MTSKNIALESAMINDAVRLLPKNHPWESVRVYVEYKLFYNTDNEKKEYPLVKGAAHCPVCNSDIVYANLEWVRYDRFVIIGTVLDPINYTCEEIIQKSEFLNSKMFTIYKRPEL